MNFLNVLKLVTSPPVSFIISLSGFVMYLVFTFMLDREIESFDDLILLPMFFTWAIFLSAFFYHAGVYFFNRISRYTHDARLKKRKNNEKRHLKENAESYLETLENEDFNLLFSLLESKGYTKRLDFSGSRVRRLKSLGLIKVKKEISVCESVFCLSENIVESVRRKYIPLYFDNVRKYFNPESEEAIKLIDMFYKDVADSSIKDVESILPYIQHLERHNIVVRDADIENGLFYMHLNEFFSIYLETLYKEKPRRNTLCIAT